MADNEQVEISDESVSDESAEAAQAKADSEIIETALQRFEQAKEAENEIRKHALDDLEFISGKQWPEQVKNERELDGRPCLVVNRLPQIVQQITNDQRQNRPAIKVHPLDSAANKDTAEIIQGIIRHIQYNSNADTARDTAFEAAARASFGFYRITTGYAAPDSFDQEIYVNRIRNQFSVLLDPYHQEPDGSDAEWGFIIEDLSKDKYRSQHPKSKLAQQGEWDSIGNQHPGWIESGSARIAEYFYKEYRDGVIHLLKTGITVKDEDLADHQAKAAAAGVDASVVQSRSTKFPSICWIKMNAVEILERTTWPGSYIPIIPVYGSEYFIEGKRVLESIVRHAKDPQRMVNFWKSAEAEAIALAPRAPFVGVEGQFENHEAEWKTANRRNHAYLEYKPISLNGQIATPPQRNNAEPAIQAITQASMAAGEDVKTTTGVYDQNQNTQTQEVSGVAIKRRSAQSQTSNFHLVDNLNRSIRHEGRILVDLIPHIYDSARAARIIGDDEAHKVVLLNQTTKDESGKQILYDVAVGRYDVTVDTGPSYATKREEAAASMMDFARVSPQVAQSCADLIVRNMDFPGADQVADRLKKLLPPQLQDDGKQMQIPPQVQAQMAQMGKMVESLSKELSETTKVIETKKLELEHKERVEAWNIQFQREKLQADIEMNLAKIGSQESVELLRQEIGAIKHENELMNGRLKLLGINQPIEAPNDFDPNQADGGNYAGEGHIGGGANIPGGETPGGPTGGNSPGLPVEGNP